MPARFCETGRQTRANDDRYFGMGGLVVGSGSGEAEAATVLMLTCKSKGHCLANQSIRVAYKIGS